MLNEFAKVNLLAGRELNGYVIRNYSKLKLSLFIIPIFLLIGIVIFLYKQDSLNVDKYIQIQKDCFFFLNSKLSQFPNAAFNFTQLGDTMILLPFLGVLIIYTPKIWETLLSALIVSCIFSTSLKKIFSVPRPAAVYDNDSFVIVGKALYGHSSLPSGHSITTFTVFTVLLFGFMPQRLKYKFLWFIFVLLTGLVIVSTRVGVGAHYPFDVIIGSIIGYISGLLGVFINERYKVWTWVNNKRYYPIFILFFCVCFVYLVDRLLSDSLMIFYLSLTALVISQYKIINVYVKK